jgi:hypothetical protein
MVSATRSATSSTRFATFSIASLVLFACNSLLVLSVLLAGGELTATETTGGGLSTGGGGGGGDGGGGGGAGAGAGEGLAGDGAVVLAGVGAGVATVSGMG